MIDVNDKRDCFPGEIWKDVPDYEGIYKVSNLGRVKSFIIYKLRGYIMKQRPDKDGYYKVYLVKDLKQKTFRTNRVVALAFIPNPENKPIVDHINEIKTDNRPENLRWCTGYENKCFYVKNRKDLPVGVSWHKAAKMYIARYTFNGKRELIGFFHYPHKAKIALDLAKARVKYGHDVVLFKHSQGGSYIKLEE